MTGCRWECNMRMQCHCDKRRIPLPLWCNWNSQQHRFWQLCCRNRDDGIGHSAPCTLPEPSVSWFNNLRPSKSQNVQFDPWDECSFSVRSGLFLPPHAFRSSHPSHKVLLLLGPVCWPNLNVSDFRCERCEKCCCHCSYRMPMGGSCREG